MHWAQALTRLPDTKPALPAGRRTHWILGYFLVLAVGLYLPRNLTKVTPSCDVFPQIVQCLGINLSLNCFLAKIALLLIYIKNRIFATFFTFMDIQSGIFLYIIIIFSAIIHEYAHGWAALRQGDPTAKYAGRLTLNPLAHIDWWGTVLMPLLLLFTFGVFFGYAKPVPINPYNFRNQRRGIIYVSLAGVGANFLIALALGLFVRFMPNSRQGFT